MMDCDTTGIEPELALVKTKKLVGGGDAVRQPDRPAGARAPGLRRRTGRGRRRLHRGAQLRDRGAASAARAPLGVRHRDGRRHDPLHGARADDGGGAAVHLQRDLQDREHAEHVTVEEVEQLFVELEARPEGRRDLPRQLQGRPAALRRQEEDRRGAGRERGPQTLPWSAKKRLPRSVRRSPRRSAWGTPRAHHGGLLPRRRARRDLPQGLEAGLDPLGIMDAFSIAVSVGLQYGVPLEDYASNSST